jgi:hypothetical protein
MSSPDYYANASRGAFPAWKNEMATLSWTPWLLFNGLSAADRVDTPALFVHSDGCVFPDHVRLVHSKLRGPKKLVWTAGTQSDFYDQREPGRCRRQRGGCVPDGTEVMKIDADRWETKKLTA